MIREDLGADWTALHSVGVANHPKKPWAELDFVLIGPGGVFCLEVKGGRVARRDDGRWEFTNRGDVSVKTEGPWDQVGSASAALYHSSSSTTTLSQGRRLRRRHARLRVAGLDPTSSSTFSTTCGTAISVLRIRREADVVLASPAAQAERPRAGRLSRRASLRPEAAPGRSTIDRRFAADRQATGSWSG